ncbi:Smr/MutS family protein [Sphingomonas sp.]|uniref:Smr/MutS family protein n=1 Tax=Sphingomonas sp. TaxID=28214 RepID=UPI003B3A8980
MTPLEGRAPPQEAAPAPIKPGAVRQSLGAPRAPAKQDHRAGPRRPAPGPPSDTLDGGWDRRLRQGSVAPDRTIDLHGHTLVSAQSALEHALARAVADDARVLLVITGKPPKPDARGRGLIRASIGDWLGTSGYRDRIAAVRHAHPRHGGNGALYVILRRRRAG